MMDWVSIKKDLPKTKTGIKAIYYLIASDFWQSKGIAKYSKEKGFFERSSSMKNIKVSHWCLFPKIPGKPDLLNLKR